MNRIIYILILLTLGSSQSNGQEKVIYHECGETASSYDIIKWNIKDKKNRLALRETIDKKGRVIKLEFLVNHNGGSLCYLPDVVEYDYQKNIIIEKLFKGGKEMEATDCEMWYKSIYHLNEKYQIEKIERFSKYDFTNVSADEIEKWKTEWAPDYRIEKPDSTMLQIDFYYHSFGKMNGVYPVSKNYVLDENNYYYGDEPEKSSIKNGIKN
jgi:hypothetical protein